MTAAATCGCGWVPGDDDDELACKGHESLAGEHMGETVHCDGSCRVPRVTLLVALSEHQRSDECAESRRMRISSMRASLHIIEQVLTEGYDQLHALQADLDAIERRYSS